jgi:cell division protein FtsN
MSRDYKPAKKSAPAKKSRGGTLLGIFIGLVFGVGAALAVVWYMNKMPVPFAKTAPPEPVKPGMPQPAAGNGAAAPVALPGKPGDAPQEKRFQFYDILPGKSEPQPDGKAETKAPGKIQEAAKPSEIISLQAGSFQNPKDAENLKATLALTGVDATVQQVMVSDKVWYRVRVGPYTKAEDASRVKAELAKSGIEANIVKGKD